MDAYLATLDAIVERILGHKRVGTYLHGSAVLGGFNPDRSDLDVLCVATVPLSPDEKKAIGEDLIAPDLRPQARGGLEMSIVTLDSARHPVAAPDYELHVNTREGRVGDGLGRTDPDLVLHFPIARQSGRLIGRGPGPEKVFAPVPRSLILAAMAKELQDAVAAGDPPAAGEYILLNACRNLAFLSTGRFASKIDGGEWVRAHVPEIDPALVIGALARQNGSDPRALLDADAVRTVAGSVERRLAEAAEAAGRD